MNAVATGDVSAVAGGDETDAESSADGILPVSLRDFKEFSLAHEAGLMLNKVDCQRLQVCSRDDACLGNVIQKRMLTTI